METILIISSVLLWLAILFNLILTFALIRRVNSTEKSHSRPLVGLNPGDRAPDFTAQKLDGEQVTLSTYKGRNIALVFISTACAPCSHVMPQLIDVEPTMRDAGVELILVSTDDAEATLTYVEQNAIPLPVLVAPRQNNSFMDDYKSIGTPSFCFITAESTIYTAGSPYFEQGEWKALTGFLSQISIPAVSERR